jgi:hypothetical protein
MALGSFLAFFLFLLVRLGQAWRGVFIYTSCVPLRVSREQRGELRLFGRPGSDGGLVNGSGGKGLFPCIHTIRWMVERYLLKYDIYNITYVLSSHSL